MSLEAASWPIFIVLKKNLKVAHKKLDQFAVSKLKLFQNNTQSRNEKKFLLEVKFPYSYLDFKKFQKRLSNNAEILGQNSLHTAGHTQTAGRTAATTGYS
jgi:hypothetical protein